MIKQFIESQAHKHVLVCFLITLFIGLWSLPIALVTAAVISFGKEIYDKYYGTGWGWLDLLGDLIGMILGSIVVGVICR